MSLGGPPNPQYVKSRSNNLLRCFPEGHIVIKVEVSLGETVVIVHEGGLIN